MACTENSTYIPKRRVLVCGMRDTALYVTDAEAAAEEVPELRFDATPPLCSEASWNWNRADSGLSSTNPSLVLPLAVKRVPLDKYLPVQCHSSPTLGTKSV